MPAYNSLQLLSGGVSAPPSADAPAGTSDSTKFWVSLAFLGGVGAFLYAVAKNDRESQASMHNPAKRAGASRKAQRDGSMSNPAERRLWGKQLLHIEADPRAVRALRKMHSEYWPDVLFYLAYDAANDQPGKGDEAQVWYDAWDKLMDMSVSLGEARLYAPDPPFDPKMTKPVDRLLKVYGPANLARFWAREFFADVGRLRKQYEADRELYLQTYTSLFTEQQWKDAMHAQESKGQVLRDAAEKFLLLDTDYQAQLDAMGAAEDADMGAKMRAASRRGNL